MHKLFLPRYPGLQTSHNLQSLLHSHWGLTLGFLMLDIHSLSFFSWCLQMPTVQGYSRDCVCVCVCLTPNILPVSVSACTQPCHICAPPKLVSLCESLAWTLWPGPSSALSLPLHLQLCQLWENMVCSSMKREISGYKRHVGKQSTLTCLFRFHRTQSS